MIRISVKASRNSGGTVLHCTFPGRLETSHSFFHIHPTLSLARLVCKDSQWCLQKDLALLLLWHLVFLLWTALWSFYESTKIRLRKHLRKIMTRQLRLQLLENQELSLVQTWDQFCLLPSTPLTIWLPWNNDHLSLTELPSWCRDPSELDLLDATWP